MSIEFQTELTPSYLLVVEAFPLGESENEGFFQTTRIIHASGREWEFPVPIFRPTREEIESVARDYLSSHILPEKNHHV